MRSWLHKTFSAEWLRVFRFGLIGALTFVIFSLLYALMSRGVWVTGNHTLQNVIATFLACIFNFFAHRHWTFRSQGKHADEIVRYIIVALTAIGLEGVLFWVGHVRLHIHDFIVAVIAWTLIPLYTYVMHRFYTFRQTHIGPHPVEKAL